MSNGLTIKDVDSNDFLYGLEITAESQSERIILSPNMEKPNVEYSDWLDSVMADQQAAHTYARDGRWSVAYTYLEDFKQPVMLPKFYAPRLQERKDADRFVPSHAPILSK